ncbi:MAG: hypothetical protein KC431_11540 [Myxococcales bacterium]|nr:hypothetical protein [Myxococcales bacterium]MCA9698148.1 hypothetical protein [Myxococcales bacterium]
MTTYNFTDEATPTLNTIIDPTGGVTLQEGTVQGDLITSNFTGASVSVSLEPPSGWSLDSVTWAGGESGRLSVPSPGVETSHSFTYTISQNGTSLSSSGNFKIKHQGSGGG